MTKVKTKKTAAKKVKKGAGYVQKTNPVGVGYGSAFQKRLERVEEAVSKNAAKIDTMSTLVPILRDTIGDIHARLSSVEQVVRESSTKPAATPNDAMWTFEEAVGFVRELERELHPYAHVTFGGGVMHKGKSTHDLDIIIFPHTTKDFDPNFIGGVLRRMNMHKRLDHMKVRKFWRKKGSDDCKRVEVWDFGGKRVDVFYLK